MINIETQASGHIWLRKGKTVEAMEEVADFPNLILDVGLREMGLNSDYLRYCSIGTSSVTPNASQTKLIGLLRTTCTNARGEQTGANSDDPNNPYVWRRVTKRFAPSGSNANISEIAFGSTSNGSSAFNRALIKDSGGNPSTITLLGDEYLDVVYELRIYPPMQDITGTFTPTGIDTSPRDYIVRSKGHGGELRYDSTIGWQVDKMITVTWWNSVHSGDIGVIFSEPSGTSTKIEGSAVMDPVGASGVITLTAALGSGNFPTGIRSIVAALDSCKYQFQFDPPFMKTADDVFTFSFRHSWGRR